MIATDILDLDTQRSTRCYSESSGFSECSSPNSRGFSPGVINSPEYSYQNMNISSEPIIANNMFMGTNIYCSIGMPPMNGCELKITEEPSDKFRFRYISEMHGTHGSLMGRNTAKSKKTYPQVKLVGFQGHGFIRCSLYQMDLTNPSPHSHLLVVRKDDRDVHDPHDVEISPNSYEAKFHGMGIIHTAKKDISKELLAKKVRLYKFLNNKEHLSVKELQLLKDQTAKEEKSMNLNQVRLCFEAFQSNPDGSFSRICDPVFSEPINNMKSALTGELKIARLSAAVSSAAGGDDLFLLVEKVGKKNIKVRFFQVDDEDELIWEDYGHFSENDVHHQYAIALRTPRYKNPDIDRTVDVFIQLVRPTDNVRSDPVSFKYKPRHTISSRKRRRLSGSSGSLSSFELPESVARVAAASASSVDGNMSISEEFNKSECLRDLLNSTNQIQMSGTGYEGFMQFVTKNSDELEGLMDPSFLDPEHPLTSMDFGRLERDSVDESSNTDRKKKLSMVMEILQQSREKSKDNQHLRIIFQRFMIGLKGHKDLNEVRNEIMETWNDYQKFNEHGDDILHHVIAESDYGNAMKLFRIIQKLEMQEVILNQNQLGESLLHIAALYRKPEFVRVLISFGCNANLQDAKGNTALHIAVMENDIDYVKAVLAVPLSASKLNINLTNDDGLSVLHLAVKNGNLDIVKFLIEVGKASVVQTISKNGNTALHVAVEETKYEIVCYLLNATNIETDIKNSSGSTALDLAKAFDMKSDIVKILLSRHFVKTDTVPMSTNDEDSDDSDSVKTLQIDENDEEENSVFYLSQEILKKLSIILDTHNQWKRLASMLHLDHLTCLWESSESLLEYLNREKSCTKQQFLDALQEISHNLHEQVVGVLNAQ